MAILLYWTPGTVVWLESTLYSCLADLAGEGKKTLKLCFKLELLLTHEWELCGQLTAAKGYRKSLKSMKTTPFLPASWFRLLLTYLCWFFPLSSELPTKQPGLVYSR